jgi:YVTN family beta-propeller protein
MSDSAPPPNGAGPTEFGVLGPLLVVRDGRSLQLGGSRQRAVLALLLLQANKAVSLSHLIAGVWGVDTPPAAVQTAQTYVFHLRRELEPDRPPRSPSRMLSTVGAGYVLTVDPRHTDVGQFLDGVERARVAREATDPAEASRLLTAALALWRGPVLDDLADYAFVQPEAARLVDLRLAAVEAKLDADLALGRHDAVAAECETWISQEPLRERLREIAVLALYRAGRQGEALSAYREARDLLAAELGVDPGPGLQRLHRAVLAQDPSLDYIPPSSHAAVPRSRAPALAGAQSMAGEDDEPPGPASTRRGFGSRRAVTTLLVLAVASTAGFAILLRPAPEDVPPRVEPSSVAVIDPESGQVDDVVPVGTEPTRVAAGAGAIWVTNRQDATVSRIDPDTRAVTQEIDVGASPEDVSVGAGYVWVANSGAGTVSQIDPATNDVVRTVDVGNGPVAVLATHRAVWVANRFDDTVWRLDPLTAEPTNKTPVGDQPAALAVVGDHVLVANSGDATVSRIDMRTRAVVSVVRVGNGPVAIGSTGATAWVAHSLDGTVGRFDPATSAQRSLEPTGDGPVGIAPGRNGTWVANQYSGTLTRLDRDTGHVVQRIAVTGAPGGLVLAGDRLWVSIGARGAAAHRGGTLRVVEKLGYIGVDPAMNYGPVPWLVYDGLVALRRTGGTSGATMVPDLATSVPEPTDGGRTYAFTLRRGVRYSDGRPVRPSDIRRGIERNLRGNPGSYYAGIIGAERCAVSPAPEACDLSDGVVTDDARYTLTIHLTQPDPELLGKLTLPFAAATAPGAPWTNAGRSPLPSTGPYRIARYGGPAGEVRLVRNPYFRQWSWAARPDGYPDVIVFEPKNKNPIEQVEQGRADATTATDPDLLVRYRSRVHQGPGSISFFMFMNTTRPPFDDVRVRRAVNLAVDRGQVLARYGGAIAGRVSCQVLPPSYPGYRPYCPSTIAPGPQWSAPDLDLARTLVRASGTAGQRVQVVTPPGDLGSLAGYFPQLLRRLGYEAQLKVVAEDAYFPALNDPTNRDQMGIYGWGPDYPGASAYLAPLFGCGGFANSAHFCNPRIDAAIRAASALERQQPAAASPAWARVERDILRLAPAVPLLVETRATFVSARVGNYVDHPVQGVLYDQMWVR